MIILVLITGLILHIAIGISIPKTVLVDKRDGEPQYEICLSGRTLEHTIIDATLQKQDWIWLQWLPEHVMRNNYTEKRRDEAMNQLFEMYKTCGYHDVCGGVFMDWSSYHQDYGWLDATVCFYGGCSYPYYIRMEVKTSYFVMHYIKNPVKLDEIINSGRYVVPNFRDKNKFNLLLKPQQTIWMDEEETLKKNNEHFVPQHLNTVAANVAPQMALEQTQTQHHENEYGILWNTSNFDSFVKDAIRISTSARHIEVAVVDIAVLVTNTLSTDVGGDIDGSYKLLKRIKHWIVFIFSAELHSSAKHKQESRYFSNGRGRYFYFFAEYKSTYSAGFGCWFRTCGTYNLEIKIDWNELKPKNCKAQSTIDKITKRQEMEQAHYVREQIDEHSSENAHSRRSSVISVESSSPELKQLVYATEPLLEDIQI